MARGDVVLFEEFAKTIGDGSHDLDNDTFKVMLVSDTSILASTATPDSADFTEVTGGTSYTAGGATVSVTWTEANGDAVFDITTNPSWTQDASGPTNIYYAIVYNSTHAGTNDAIAYVDMGGPVSLQDGDVSITWNAAGLFTHSV